ncbi:MAG TPA: universal stress protein [Stellaceae bacterium]|nr:universal stress protein [Stellaceae bacterium]
MSLSDILVCLDSTEAAQGRLKLAARLAQQHAAFLIAAYVLDDGGDAPARAEQAEERFRETLRMQSIRGDWRLVDGPDTAEVVALAKSVDLVVLGQYARDANGSGFRPDEVATSCGRPLLIVPYAGEFASVGDKVLIAWDGTREATRALNDALPLMEGAKAATVMTVLAKEGEFPQAHAALRQVIGHLEHHGVAASAEETLRGDMTISDLLLSRAADLGADMIVAGAYHHSQLREALIGGVSRDLLRHMTVPVLMSH